MCSLQLSRHKSTKRLTVAPPYIPDAVVPAPHLGFVQVRGSQSPSMWDGLGHVIWRAIFSGNRTAQKSYTGTLKQCS
jgi:hypothetical protein